MTNDNNNTAEEQTLSPSQLRLLRTVVIITGVFLVVGFFVLAFALVYKMTSIKSASTSGKAIESTLNISKGSNVKSLSLNEDSLAIYLDGPDKQEILIIKVKSGKVINRIQLKQE